MEDKILFVKQGSGEILSAKRIEAELLETKIYGQRQWRYIAPGINPFVMEGKGGIVTADLAVLDLTWKLAPKQALRIEAQGLWTQEDKGNWAMLLAEYSISPHWFFSVSDQYNYGNPDENKQVHFLYTSFGYIKDATRIQLSYGKQREGILCIGGVCRNVPAMNGFSLSITSSFY